MNRKKTFSSCLIASLCLHLAALLFFQKYSLWFSSAQTDVIAENWLSHVDKKERDEILKTAFESTGEPKEITHQPQTETPYTAFRSLVQIQEMTPSIPIAFDFSLPSVEPLLKSPVFPVFSLPTQTFNLLDHLPKDLIVPTPPSSLAFQALSIDNSPIPKSNTPLASSSSETLDFTLAGPALAAKAPDLIPMPNLPKLPTLAELETSSYSDSFDADLVFLPRENGKGYIFALTLIPHPDLNLPKLPQHITFLIDRSNSIQQGRLSSAKSAVHKALEELSPEDTFNIIAFDHKIEKMSPHYLPCIGKSYASAEAFLEKIQLGSFFSSSDLFKPLLLTVPNHVTADEIHTAILLTDGEAFAKKTAPKSVVKDWTEYNRGIVSLFTICMSDTHMATLDAASALNRGKVIHVPTQRGLKRKLLKLMKTIQHPIAKDLSCHAISKSPQTKIQIYPKASQMSHLYLDQPYVILGETETLDDFILFVQGRLKGRWLNVRKNISFINARKGNRSLKQEIALQKAYHLYEQYNLDENPKHIAEAKELLEPYHFQTAF
jgi:hypothetical protein